MARLPVKFICLNKRLTPSSHRHGLVTHTEPSGVYLMNHIKAYHVLVYWLWFTRNGIKNRSTFLADDSVYIASCT